MAQPTLIAPFATGLDTDTESWMSPSDSFSEADNVHVYNGYVEKRSGYRKFGNLVGLDLYLAIANITKALNGVVTTVLNHGLSTDAYVFITNVLGMTQVNGLYFKITVTGLNTFQLNSDTSTFGIYTGGGNVQVNTPWTDRVMGIFQFTRSDGSKETIAFGTKRACKYDVTANSFLSLDSSHIMDGSAYDFIWAVNLQSSSLPNRLYFTNGKEFSGVIGGSLNGIRYYDGTTNYTTTFTPSLGVGRNLYGGKLLFCLKERLIVLNTYELNGINVTNYPQRARWCQAQGPSNWNDVVPGGGGYTDAPTGDQIISARALQDQIIVFFSRSVWALRLLSDPALPFTWVKLNDIQASDGKMASIGYDKYIMALGVRGITGTDGVETQRIDTRIRDFVTSTINLDEFSKVYVSRSFDERRTWILYPSLESSENSAALIFDEESNAFTTYSISMNCLGIGSLSQDYTLADFIAANDLDLIIDDFDDETLVSYVSQGKEDIFLGGTIDGKIYVMETENSDDGLTIFSTLTTAGWNPFQTQGSQSQFLYLDIYVDTHKKTIATVEFFKDDETKPYATQNIDFLPNLDYVSTCESITQANPGVVTASDHGLETGDKVYIYGAEGMDQINTGPYTIIVIDKDSFSVGIDTSGYAAYANGASVYKRQFYKTKVWKRAFAGGTGYLHKVRISSEGLNTPFRISGFKPVFKPRGTRVVN